MKKIISLLICICILASSISVLANEDTLGLKSPSCLLMEQSTGKILYEKDIHTRRPLASVTKIMTMLLAMEKIQNGELSYDDVITGSEYAKSMGGSTIFLDAGEQMSVRDILKGIAVASGNDASVAIAEYIAGSETAFVDMMNQKAAELGMENTHFVNCNGLPEENHYSTAYDIALMSRAIMNYPDIFNFTTIWMDSLRNGEFTLSNTNKLIRFYEGATGLKTGSTNEAKFCISATAKRNDMHLIAVVMAGETSKERNADASSLLNYGFANFSLSFFAKKDDVIQTIYIPKSKNGYADVVCSDDVSYISKKNDNVNIEQNIVIDEELLILPLKKGDVVGKLEVKSGDTLLSETPLTVNADVNKLTVFASLGKIINSWTDM